MGNTVGSQRILNLHQQNLIIGTLLGDGTLELNGSNVRLRIDHSVKQERYVQWKHKILYNLANNIKYYSQKRDERTNKKYHHCKFDTISCSALNRFQEMFYQDNKKIVPRNINKILKSHLALAVWYMDDGYKRNDCNALRMNTDTFSLKDQILLQNCLRKNFSIYSKIHRKGKYWNIYIPESEAKKFCKIVKPYIISEMKYKISLTP